MIQSVRRSTRSLWSSLLSATGALMVLIGAQLPVLEFDLAGPVNYGGLPGNAGIALPLAAVAVLLAVVLQEQSWRLVTAVALWIALMWPVLREGYFRLLGPDRGAIDEIGSALGDVVGRAIGNDLLAASRLREGGVALLVGCMLVSVGAFRRSRG